MTQLIPFPPYPVDGETRYRVRARPKRAFRTVLDASKMIDPEDPRDSVVRIETRDDGLVLEVEHPFIDGLIRERLTMRRTDQGLVAQDLLRTVTDRSGGRQLRREEADFADSNWPLPPATYPETATPCLVCFHPFDGKVRDLYSWINDRFVARMMFQSRGLKRVDLPDGPVETIEVMLYPDINDWVPLGRTLTRLVRPFLPKYRAWYATEPPHTLLRFEGPYGPPGAPELILERTAAP